MTGIIREATTVVSPLVVKIVVESARKKLMFPAVEEKCGLLRLLLQGGRVPPENISIFSDSDLMVLARIFDFQNLVLPKALLPPLPPQEHREEILQAA